MKKINFFGFTLVELLVVVSIVAFLAAMAIGNLGISRIKARDARRSSDLKQIANALNVFYDRQNSYPRVSGSGAWSEIWDRMADCLAKGTDCGFTPVEFQPIMTSVPRDPSGGSKTYFYWYCDNGQKYRLLAILERNDATFLNGDLDGNFYQTDARCQDAAKGYCVGSENWCW